MFNREVCFEIMIHGLIGLICAVILGLIAWYGTGINANGGLKQLDDLLFMVGCFCYGFGFGNGISPTKNPKVVRTYDFFTFLAVSISFILILQLISSSDEISKLILPVSLAIFISWGTGNLIGFLCNRLIRRLFIQQRTSSAR